MIKLLEKLFGCWHKWEEPSMQEVTMPNYYSFKRISMIIGVTHCKKCNLLKTTGACRSKW
jgi:hypothetical protein